jgi:hypothetical protein
MTTTAPPAVHPWSTELHPPFCVNAGCGGLHTTQPDPIPTVVPDDEILVGGEISPAGVLIHLVVPTRNGQPVEAKLAPADALDLAAAITAQVNTVTAGQPWETRDTDLYLTWLRHPEATHGGAQ